AARRSTAASCVCVRQFSALPGSMRLVGSTSWVPPGGRCTVRFHLSDHTEPELVDLQATIQAIDQCSRGGSPSHGRGTAEGGEEAGGGDGHRGRGGREYDEDSTRKGADFRRVPARAKALPRPHSGRRSTMLVMAPPTGRALPHWSQRNGT